MIQAFPDHQDFPTALRKLIRRNKMPEETWTEYYFTKMQLLRQCDISGRNAVAMLIDGIQDNAIKSGAQVGRYITPEDLYKDYLSTLPAIRRQDKPEISRKQGKRQEEHEQPRNPDLSKTPRRGKCYNCKEYGHIHSNCPKPKIECTSCKKIGHLAENCFKNKSKPIRKAMLCDTESNFNGEGYHVVCFINGQEIQGFVDSGCEVVLVRESDARRLGLQWLDTDICINGYGGGVVKVLGYQEVDLKVDLFEAKVRVLIVADYLQSMPMLVGRSILNKSGAVTVMRDRRKYKDI